MISAQVRIPVPLWFALLSLLGGCAWPAAGLRPLPLLMRGGPITREVDSRQPTLRWEAFPRPEDLKADKEGRLANARSVTYELRIWRGEYNFPAEPVYVRTRLTEPIHTVEKELAPNTLYFWTIRAHFYFNGEPRVTQWGVLTLVPSPGTVDARAAQIPHPGYYRLKTPTQEPDPRPFQLQITPP